MILGSVLCAGAPISHFAMLLAGRGLEGMGSAGLLILTENILADGVSLRENAKNNSVFTLIIGVGYSTGPVFRGYLTSASWRWVIIINFPLSVIGLLLLHFFPRSILLGPRDIVRHGRQSQSMTTPCSVSVTKRLATIDYTGQLLFLLGIGLHVLSLTWAGSYHPWVGARVLAPLVVGAVFTAAFVAWEALLGSGRGISRHLPLQKGMIPIEVLWTRN